MAVFLLILKIIGWTLLGILALVVAVLLFALVVKVRFHIEYSAENTSVALQWLFLKFRLYPMEKKEKKPKQKKAKEEKKEEEKPEEEKKEEAKKPAKKKDNFLTTFYEAEGFEGVLAILKKTGAYLKTFTGNLIRGFVVDEFFLEMCCVKEDAAATAIYYGEVCAAVFPILGAFASRCRLKKYNVNIYPDYLARYPDASFALSFHITPIYYIGVILALGMKMLFGVLLKLLLPRKKKKTVQEPEINVSNSEEKSEEQ